MRTTLASLLCGLLAAIPAAQEPVPAQLDVRALRQQADAAVQKQDWKTATDAFQKLTQATPKDGQAWLMLGYCLHADNKLDEALKIHIKASEFDQVGGTAAYNAACVYSLKGDADQAIQWLDTAAKKGFANVDHIDTDSDMDAIRKDPRFQQIVERMKRGTGGDAGARGAVRYQVYTGQTDRKCARVALFTQNSSPGQLVIDYGPVAWKADYEQRIASPELVNRKWRLGRDFWTSLDTSLDLEIAGVPVPAGQYYLTLEHRGDHKFVLGLHDAAQARKQKLDAYVAHLLKGGIEVPLQHGKTDAVAEELSIAVTMAPGSQKEGELGIHFGPHRLTGKVALKY